MYRLWVVACICIASADDKDLSSLAPAKFALHHQDSIGILTTENGAPVHKKDINGLNRKIMYNGFLMDTMTHFVREKIPERLVHAKGGGAFGYFELTKEFSEFSKAKMFSKIGKKTKILLRFSTNAYSSGSQDTVRDPRGFAIKFYTEEGNLDLPCFSTPMYVYKDPVKFISFGHSFKRHPKTYMYNINTRWDYITGNPECMFFFMMVYGDRGIPRTYRRTRGHTIHTYQFYNEIGESYYGRLHFLPDAGFDYYSTEEANALLTDPDYFVRDFYNSIENGNYPSWTVYIQLLTSQDLEEGNVSDIFDVTKILPENKYPMRELGKIVLNKNPDNYFADVEQAAFCPSNLVPGILGAPDKIFESRCLAYKDAQNYRLGGNFMKIPVNCPLHAISLNRDGEPHLGDNYYDIPNYIPNSYKGAVSYEDPSRPEILEIVENDANNYDQAGEFYINEMSEGERCRMIDNIVSDLENTELFLQEKAVKLFYKIHPDFGIRVNNMLGLNSTECNSKSSNY